MVSHSRQNLKHVRILLHSELIHKKHNLLFKVSYFLIPTCSETNMNGKILQNFE